MRRGPGVVAALCVLLASTAIDAPARAAIWNLYEDDGAFVEWPALGFGLITMVPTMVLATPICIPVGAAVDSDDIGGQTFACAAVAGIAVGIGGYLVGGAPFKGIKAVFWDLPSVLAAGRGSPPSDDAAPHERSAPVEEPIPAPPDVDMRG